MRHLALLLLLAGSARGGDDPAEALLREIDAIVAERREGGRGADADALAAEVADLRRRLAENGAPGPSAVPETHVVYVRDVPERKVDVRVTVRSRPVVLVLGSQEAVTWHVDAQGADLSRIVTFWGRDRLVIAEPRVPVETLRQRSFEDDGPPYASLARQVELASGRAVTTFLGAEKPDPGKPFVVGPENPEWSAQEVRADVRRLHWCSTRARRAAFREELKKERFGFLYRWREGDTLHAAFGDWTPLGPLLARQRAIWDVLSAADVGVRDEERDELYVLRARALIRCPLAHPQQSEVLRVPDTLPEARESSALAIDTRRQRLLLATRHELGYLYALDLVKREWSVLNDLDGVDASGMFFDERRDAVLCVERRKDGTLRLERFSPEDGRHLNGTALRVPPLPDDRPLAGACLGNHLILLYPPPESQAHRVGEDSLAFVVDAITGDLIHGDRVRCWEDFEPVPEPRLARMWEALSAPDDDAEAGRAMRWLAGQGDRGVAFLAERFKPVPGTAEDLGRWVRMLSDDDTLRRDLAQFRLVDAGARAQEYLAGLDLDALPPEARRRVAAALRQVEEPGRNRRALRAIAVLEWIDTRAAEALLKELAAKGDPRRTAAAEQALLRMSAPRR